MEKPPWLPAPLAQAGSWPAGTRCSWHGLAVQDDSVIEEEALGWAGDPGRRTIVAWPSPGGAEAAGHCLGGRGLREGLSLLPALVAPGLASRLLTMARAFRIPSPACCQLQSHMSKLGLPGFPEPWLEGARPCFHGWERGQRSHEWSASTRQQLSRTELLVCTTGYEREAGILRDTSRSW